MSKIIKEHAENAGLYIRYNDKPYPKQLGAEQCDEVYQKFAELIIKECGMLIDQYQFEKNNPNSLRVKPLPLIPSEFIYQYFGIYK